MAKDHQRTRPEQIKFCHKLVSLLQTEPLSLRTIAAQVRCSKSTLEKYLYRLTKGGLLVQPPKRGVFRGWLAAKPSFTDEEMKAALWPFKERKKRESFARKRRVFVNNGGKCCRFCNKPLPPDRYFNCYRCVPSSYTDSWVNDYSHIHTGLREKDIGHGNDPSETPLE